MADTTKTVIYSLIAILFSLSLLSAFWLGIENRKIYSHYLEEKSLWYQKNRDLEFKLDKFNSELQKIRDKMKNSDVYVAKLKQKSLDTEGRLKELADENQALREKVTRLTKEKEELTNILERYKQTKIDKTQDTFLSNVLREKANLELKLNSLERLLARKDSEISNLNNERQTLNLAMNELLDKKIELEKRLEETKSLISNLSQSLEQRKQEIFSYLKEMDKLEKEKETLRFKVAEAQETKVNLEQRVKELQENIVKEQKEKEKFAHHLGYITQLLEDKMLNVSRLKQDLELALVKIKKLGYDVKGEQVFLPKIEIKDILKGRVVNVDLENGFVIIDLGKRDGVEKDMEFNVYRNDRMIAKLQVIDIREVTSACKILLSLPQDNISENDSVSLSKE